MSQNTDIHEEIKKAYEAGHFDAIRDEALKDFQEGRCLTELEDRCPDCSCQGKE